MLEVCLSDESGPTVRAAAIVTRRKPVETQDLQSPTCQLFQGRTADAADSQHDDVERGIAMQSSRDIPFRKAIETSQLFGSGEDLSDDLAADVCQAEIAARVAEGQALVIQAQEVQDRGLQIVDVDRVFDDVKTQIVGGAIERARLDAAAGHPHRECLRVMIAAQATMENRVAFHHRRAAEFAAPNHERLIEQTALFEVAQGRLPLDPSPGSSGGGCRSDRCERPNPRDRC